jgi:hypothetical protein
MKKLVVSYDDITWNEIVYEWFGFNVASNLKKYNFGEDLPNCEYEFDAFKCLLSNKGLSIKDILYMPIYAYIHSGISFSVSDYFPECPYGFDTGLAGFVWIEKKEYAKMFGYKRVTKKLRDKFVKDVKNLVSALNQEYVVISVEENGEIIDSISGIEYDFDEKELIEKAVEHGLINKNEKNNLQIEFREY